MVGSRLVSNGLIFSDDIPVNTQLVTFCYYPMLGKVVLRQKLKVSDNQCHL